jgi:hypothetical protein
MKIPSGYLDMIVGSIHDSINIISLSCVFTVSELILLFARITTQSNQPTNQPSIHPFSDLLVELYEEMGKH